MNEWLMPVIFIVTLIALASFALGTRANVRTGERVAKWLQDGLPILSDKTTMTWIGSAAVLFKMARAKPPYRNAEIVLSFEPRDVVLMWWLAHWQGRRDLMIFRGVLTSAPNFDLEVFDPQVGIQRYRQSGRRQGEREYTLPQAPHLRVYSSAALTLDSVEALVGLLARAGGTVTRLSIQRTPPNVEVHWLLPQPQRVSARQWFQGIREFGQRIVQGIDFKTFSEYDKSN